MKNILVLCVGNSCRSQMAHGYLQHFAGDKATVYSAGAETHGVNPYAIKVMAEDGIDISHHTSNLVDEYAGYPIDTVITVCDNGDSKCPYFPGYVTRIHQPFNDPKDATGTEEEVLNVFRRVRDEIKGYAQYFVQHDL